MRSTGTIFLLVLATSVLTPAFCQKLFGEVLPNQGICTSIDVRNSLVYLNSLRNCSQIVGSLQIVLIEGQQAQKFKDYVFPELKEVTEYFIMYRVEGLTTLSHMFPNLAIIRGQHLFMNYAFIIYELPQLQEIGLRSLTTIVRGYVRLERNAQLCYTNTVNWTLITGKSKGHVFLENGPSSCPGSETCRGCDGNFCWSAKHCQRNPSSTCHPECLGGCTNTKQLCYRCKNYIHVDTCVPTCPPDTYKFPAAAQCLTKELCSKMYRRHGWTWNGTCIGRCPRGYRVEGVGSSRTCVLCVNCSVQCEGSEITSLSEAQYYKGCTHVDGSLHIRFIGEHNEDVMKEMEENLGSIEQIRGFLKVYRSLPITSLNFLKKLTAIHGVETEFDKYALVVYEMNNLQTLWNWTHTKDMTISNGSFFFHFNSKLCLDQIEHLVNVTHINVTSFDVSPQSNGYKKTCNLITLLTNSSVVDTKKVSISWDRFKPNTTSQTIMGYTIYFIEDPKDDITSEFGRDSCYHNGWKSLYEIEPRGANISLPPSLNINITDLKPSTKYAYYVETYSSAEETYVPGASSRHGRSKIGFFTMEMDVPPKPAAVVTHSHSADSITIYWQDNPKYKGTITRYLVELIIQPDEKSFLDQRNYCHTPLIPENTQKKYIPTDESVENKNKTGETDAEGNTKCDCSKQDSIWDDLVQQDPNLEFQPLHTSSAVCKNLPTENKRAPDIINEIKCGFLKYETEGEEININVNDIEKEKPANDNDDLANGMPEAEAKLEVTEDFGFHQKLKRDTHTEFDPLNHLEVEPKARPVLPNVTREDKYHTFSTHFHTLHKNYTLKNLKHFTKYLIHLAACKGPLDNDCGVVAISVQRTLKVPGSDELTNVSVALINGSEAVVSWPEPKNPNGAVLSYTVEHKKLDIANFKPVTGCITRQHHEMRENKHLLGKLLPGPYSVRVRATSLAGDANYTQMLNFTIPEPPAPADRPFDYRLLVGVIIATVLVVGLLFGLYVYRKRRNAIIEDRVDLLSYRSLTAHFSRESGEGSVSLLGI